MKNKEYKTVVESTSISYDRDDYSKEGGFNTQLRSFLKDHQSLKILSTIVHAPYQVTIIYSELTEMP